MGLLDDAIREHLDLKRRRGADPAEIERAEREALGPVRREPLAREEAPLDAGDEADAGTGSEPPPLRLEDAGPEGSEPYEIEEPEPIHGQERGFASDLEDDELEDEDWEDYEDDDFEFEEAPESGLATGPPGESPPAPTPAPADPREAEGLGADPDRLGGSSREHDETFGDTVAYDIEPAGESPKPAGGEPDDDVLEETPEFLQDTPDHDRLWFEQKPPKDFDFDE